MHAHRYACPDVCRFSPRAMAISGPILAMLFIMATTRVSLPGMILALYSSRSLGVSRSRLDASFAASESAARGSACACSVPDLAAR